MTIIIRSQKGGIVINPKTIFRNETFIETKDVIIADYITPTRAQEVVDDIYTSINLCVSRGETAVFTYSMPKE